MTVFRVEDCDGGTNSGARAESVLHPAAVDDEDAVAQEDVVAQDPAADDGEDVVAQGFTA